MKRIVDTSVLFPYGEPGRYYYAGAIGGDTTTWAVTAIDRMFSAPLMFNKRVIIDKISLLVTTGAAAGGVGRVGIYADNGELFPGTLIEGSAELVTTVAQEIGHTLASPLTLEAGEIVWLSCLFGVAVPTVRSLVSGSAAPIWGSPDPLVSLDMRSLLYSAQAYGAMPAVHPAATDYDFYGSCMAARIQA